jgi:hypothetical protein
LQAFWPLQDDEPILQALVPLHELTPLHFTPSACAAVAKLPAANMAVAVAMRVFLVIDHSLVVPSGASAPHRQTMTPASFTGKSALGDEA